MKGLARTALTVTALLVVAAPLAATTAEARGGGARLGGFGGKRGGGKQDSRWNAQSLLLISDCVRDDNVRRMRHVDW